ncbi:MAG: hypothetical protein CSB34_06605 [Desulfobulbus propionicus]|nr:MAG: hypothetical protein CSB34_06605 [Desulfobulbus propionicus]
MEAFLDTAWEYIAAGFTFAGETLFGLTQHLHVLGPAVLITILALLTVCVTKLLNRVIITRRFVELEKVYHHWLALRQEAMALEDRDKAGRLARNIDQAELNKAYYDYFFEGLLLGIARKVLPIFFVAGFVNEFYKQENLVSLFGQDYVIRFVNTQGEPVLVGALFWYFISLLSGYLLWAIGKKITAKLRTGESGSLAAGAKEIKPA